MIHVVIGAMIVLVSQQPAIVTSLATVAAAKAPAAKPAATDKDKKTAEKASADKKSDEKAPETKAPEPGTPENKPSAAKGEAGAASSMGAYSKVGLEHADKAIFTLDGKLVSMVGGVKLILTPTDPASPPVSIQTEKLTASYAEGAKMPSHLLLDGKVAINHPQGMVHAARADWDFATNSVTFTGNPVMDSPTAKGIEAEQIILSFGDGRLQLLGNARIKEGIPLNAAQAPPGGNAVAAAPPSSALLKDGDIKDWTAFITLLKKQAAEPAASPGRQIASLLDSKVQRAIASATPDQVVQQKETVLKQLNKAITSPGLYSEAAWKGVALDDETTALLKKEARTPQEQVRLNRLLVAAAYPDLVAKPPKE